MQLDIHQLQRLLHAQRLLRHQRDKVVAMAPVRAHLLDFYRRQETALQQAERVELAQPATVPDIGLATGDVLAVARVDETYAKARFCEDLVGWDPIDAGGLHHDMANMALLQPRCHRLNIGSEASECAYRWLGTIIGDRHIMRLGPDVYPSRVFMHHRLLVEEAVIDLGGAGGLWFRAFHFGNGVHAELS